MHEDWQLWGFNPNNFENMTLEEQAFESLLVVNRTNALLLGRLITVREYSEFLEEIAKRIKTGVDTGG